MKREAKLLLDRSIDSLILSISHFNSPQEVGRINAVLILLDHSFELLLKSAIIEQGGKIRLNNSNMTIGFDACLRLALSELRFISNEDALTLQSINGLRDAAQHYFIDVCEQQLYMHCQAGVTLYRNILNKIFNISLYTRLPARVLPISTMCPTDINTLFDREVAEIKQMLVPGKRKTAEAYAKLRPLKILDSNLRGEKDQPSESDLEKVTEHLRKGVSWEQLFPGVASINITAEGSGPSIDLRFTKKEGIPIHIVKEGTPGASVVGLKRVNELEFYSFGMNQLAEKLDITIPRARALAWKLEILNDETCFKVIKIGKTEHRRYSQKAFELMRKALNDYDVDDIWSEFRDNGFS